MTDNMRAIVIEERLERGLDVSAADLEFLIRRKKKRADDEEEPTDLRTCPTCGGSGKIRAVPVDDDEDDDDKEREDRKAFYEEDDD
jgi:hypothetical protein